MEEKNLKSLQLQKDNKLFALHTSKECNHWKGNLLQKYTLKKGVIRLLFLCSINSFHILQFEKRYSNHTDIGVSTRLDLSKNLLN